MRDETLGIPSVVGHFSILEKIGSGGMGDVYRAFDEHLEREVAIKVLPRGMLTDDSVRRRFRREALSLSKLNHPNIATIHDFDEEVGRDYLVMEYIAGQTLSARIAAGPVPEREIARLGTQLTQGLIAAHERGIVHRDLKPSNLILTPDGRLKILDFGLAKLVHHPLGSMDSTESSTRTSIRGTIPYMAPEQLDGKDVDARTDIYAVGMVLYEMATGRRPFDPNSTASLIADILNTPPPPPGRLQLNLSPRLEEIILKCLEKDPGSRYQSAKELQVDLRRMAPSILDGKTEIRLASGARKSLQPSRGAVIAALLLVGSGSFVAYRLVRKPPATPSQPPPISHVQPGASPKVTPEPTPTPSAVPQAAAAPELQEGNAPEKSSEKSAPKNQPPTSAKGTARAERRPQRSSDFLLTRDDVPGLLTTASGCMNKGDYRCAITRYKQALELSPQSQDAREGLERALKAEQVPH